MWSFGSTKPIPSSFMNNKLSFLKKDLDKYILTQKYCMSPGCSIILFGKIFQSSFYIFGYAVRNFKDVSSIVYYTMSYPFWEFLNYIGLTPPKLFFSQPVRLSDTFNKISHKDFENVFITIATNVGKGQLYDNVEGIKYKPDTFKKFRCNLDFRKL